jgi:ferric-dicitrate binding protein FerR (iron transport regulator)
MPAESQRDGVRRAFRGWLLRNPETAAEWLEPRPLEPFFDPGYAVIAQSLDPMTSSEEAIDWCGRISDPDLGARCLVAVASRWYGREPAAAEAWLAENALDPEAQRKIRAGARKRGPRGK